MRYITLGQAQSLIDREGGHAYEDYDDSTGRTRYCVRAPLYSPDFEVNERDFKRLQAWTKERGRIADAKRARIRIDFDR